MIIIALIIILVTLLYKYGTRNFQYWEKKGVKHDKPIPFFGNNARQILQQISVTEILVEMYKKYPNEKYVGFYEQNNLQLILRDPELVKQVLVADFYYFYERGLNAHKDVIEPMLKNLFYADGDLWKLLRQRMTPAFTSGKLKAMFPLIVERAEKLQKIASTAAESGQAVDVRDLMARYTTDFIGACGFGIDTDSLNDDTSKFRQLGKRIFEVRKRDILIIILKGIAPDLFKHLKITPSDIVEDTVWLLRSVMKQRNYKPCGRNDFIDLLLDLKQKGKIVGESIEKRNPDGTPITVDLELDEELMAAQVLIFFAAGFETSSSATSFTLHQLAFHPDKQKECQREVDEVLSRHNGKLCYDAVKEMKYLGMAFKEGMRMYPSLGYLIRKCAKKYTFQDTNLTIDEGVTITIPVMALQNDEKYFEEPEMFKPERFHPDNAEHIKKHVYLPFGEGPRACIGERLGLMQSLAGLAALLSKFSVAPAKTTLRHPVTDPTSTIVQVIKNGLPLALIAREKA